MSLKEDFIGWLNNSYAMEQQIAKDLEAQLDDFDDFPQIKEQIEKHLKETQSHAETVKSCIEQLGGEVSSLKSGMAQMMGMGKGVLMDFMGDKAIKNTIGNFAIENFEIANYAFLISIASELGEEEVADTLVGILDEENEMADWIFNQIPSLAGGVAEAADD